jgi:hypothetical protein
VEDHGGSHTPYAAIQMPDESAASVVLAMVISGAVPTQEATANHHAPRKT